MTTGELTCCDVHDGPHLHGCKIRSMNHRGACILPERSAAVLSEDDRDALICDVMDAHERVNHAEAQLRGIVDEARRRGLSWSDVGAGVGMTKQAASYKFKSSRVDYADQELG